MSNISAIEKIKVRYNKLSDTECCLSCGQALSHSDPKEGEYCADLGCGKGNDVIRMAEAVGESGFVYGLDISSGMLEKAKKNAEKFGVNNVEFIKTELETLPLDDDKIDLVISNCTINHVRDKQLLWNEVYRILRNNGRFVVSDIYTTEDVPEEYSNDPEAVAECWAGAVTKDEYMKQLYNAGFKEVTILEESEPYEKGKIKVSSFTIMGEKKNEKKCCCCS